MSKAKEAQACFSRVSSQQAVHSNSPVIAVVVVNPIAFSLTLSIFVFPLQVPIKKLIFYSFILAFKLYNFLSWKGQECILVFGCVHSENGFVFLPLGSIFFRAFRRLHWWLRYCSLHPIFLCIKDTIFEHIYTKNMRFIWYKRFLHTFWSGVPLPISSTPTCFFLLFTNTIKCLITMLYVWIVMCARTTM